MKLTPEVKKQLVHLLGPKNVLTDEVSLALYGYDCSLSRTRPDAVVLIQQTTQIAPLLALLYTHKIPFVPRASATNHAGSCTPLRGGVIINLTALNHILQINTQAGFAVVEPGVINAQLQEALAPLGFFYAPDPASEQICTLGGNLAQNASGARCMKYGGTINHVLEAKWVLPDGTSTQISRENGGIDVLGLLTGSEGTLGIATQLKVKILPLAKYIRTFLVTFPSLEESVQAVSALTAAGIVPRCVEAMDNPSLRAVETFAHAGYPLDAPALLILELDGTPAHIQKEEKVLRKICLAHHALTFIPAKTEAQRQALWRGRKSAFAAMARLAPNVLVGDGTVPCSALPKALAQVRSILDKYHVQASLLFHAGDGNFHPHILFDTRNLVQTHQTMRAIREILQVCLACGGTLSGEHGIGVEKRALMATQYDVPTLQAMARIKRALDPLDIANPLKILPDRFAEKAAQQAPLPTHVKELQEKILNTQQPLVITGLNTWRKTKYPHVLSARTLNQIIEIDKTNYTVTAQAGVSLQTLHKALAKEKVYCPLPKGNGSLGGAFCSGCFPAFYAQVMGVEALLADGSFIRYGGKYTKNAAGYPLTRVLAGSQGTLGLVTQLTFKVFSTRTALLKPLPFAPAVQTPLSSCLCRAWDASHRWLNVQEEVQYG